MAAISPRLGDRKVVEVVDPGLLTVVEDLGRPGYAHLGVGRSGAADRSSFRLANRLVGHLESAAALEITLGGAAFRFRADATIAFTGAPVPITVGHRAFGPNAPIAVRTGDFVSIERPSVGLRTYLAVRGGVAVPPVLGSRSRDVLADLGPPPLRPGDLLPIGHDVDGLPNVDVAPVPGLPTIATLRIRPGPRANHFTPDALATLTGSPYTVTPALDRVGIRLLGAALRRRATEELPPEGTVTGAIQVPPNGQPVLFLADHPVTGGYPVVAVVASTDHDLAAQVRPGQKIRFLMEPYSAADAIE
jgi:biotin-dependent carboxylase-like uncharacterized protein